MEKMVHWNILLLVVEVDARVWVPPELVFFELGVAGEADLLLESFLAATLEPCAPGF